MNAQFLVKICGAILLGILMYRADLEITVMVGR